MSKKQPTTAYHVPENILSHWQEMVDILAVIADIPAGLIMRIDEDDIEVFVSSASEGNPYKPGDREHLVGSGLYCETVISSGRDLHVPDALADEEWKDNPDIKLSMISYLGFPILLPDSTPFGTICILDHEANSFSPATKQLIEKVRDLIQSHLELIYMNAILGEENTRISDYLDEIQALRGHTRICATCKKIHDGNSWNPVEKYLIKHPHADFSHGYCPDCYNALMADAVK